MILTNIIFKDRLLSRIAAYVRAKLVLGADESCTEREPLGLDPSLSDDLNRGATSFLSDYLKDQVDKDTIPQCFSLL